MNPSYKQISDLFGLSAPAAPEGGPDALPVKREGSTAQESSELGGMSLSEGDYEKAIEHFRRALEQAGNTDIARRIDLGGAYEFAEMAPQALRQYLEAIRVRDDAPEPHLGVAEIYKREGRWRDSIAELEAALRHQPNNPFYLFKLAELYAESGHRHEALVAIQGAVAGAPEDSFYHYWMGDLLLKMGENVKALQSFRAAIELSPGDDLLYVRAAVAFWRTERQTEAIKAIRLASDLDPDNHLYHGILELLLSEMGLDVEADLEAGRAAQMDPYDQDLLNRFAAEVGLVA